MKRQEIASKYISENFEPEDRIAVVLLNKRSHATVQRIATAEKIAAPEFQAWLRHMNAERYEVYVSMNTLLAGARGRTRGEIDQIRHIYLDFDYDGTAAVQALVARSDLPQPNYVVSSSPDKWQTVWKVAGFEKDQAERLERGLAHDSGADPAVVDAARVLRLPGFYNHKYSRAHLVTVETRSKSVSRPEHFPEYPADGRLTGQGTMAGSKLPAGHISQSELDWAYVRSALREGASESELITQLAMRRQDKHDPQYYAERTVRRAADSMRVQPVESEPDR